MRHGYTTEGQLIRNVSAATLSLWQITRHHESNHDKRHVFHSPVNDVSFKFQLLLSSLLQPRGCTVTRSLSADAAKTLVQAPIPSRLDYCNALLYGVSEGLMRRLPANTPCLPFLRKLSADGVTSNLTTPVLQSQPAWYSSDENRFRMTQLHLQRSPHLEHSTAWRHWQLECYSKHFKTKLKTFYYIKPSYS